VYFDFGLEDWPMKTSQRDLVRIKRMLKEGEGAEIQAAIYKWLPYAVDVFGEPDSSEERRLLELGIKTRTNQMVRQYFIDTVVQELKEMGLEARDPYQGAHRRYPAGSWKEYRENSEWPRGCYPFFWVTADQMPNEARDTFSKLVTMQLTREGGGGPEKSGVGATRSVRVEYPTIEQFLHGAQISGDESCHMYGLASVAKSLGADPYPIVRKSRSANMEERRQVREIELFRNPLAYGSWIAHNVRRIFSERAGGYASIASLGSTYLPWAIWNARNFMDEGIVHSRDSAENLKALIDAGHREEIQQRFNKLFPWGIDMFGANDSENNRTYVKWGVKTLTNRECRALWLLSLQEDAEFAGLEMPGDPYQGVRTRYDD
jgi:1,2-phenylacetyl-CoA epoxidase catalytic subunit